MEQKNNSEITMFAKSLRKNMTKQERRLWYDFLREYPVKFYRQKVLGKYIVDFYCAKAKLVIELDGSQHFDPVEAAKDAERTKYLEQFDLRIVRIPNNEVDHNLAGVCDYIDRLVREAVGK